MKILFFRNFKNWKLCALRLVFVNEIKLSILFYLWNCRRRCIFRRAPPKNIFSMQIVLFTFYRKSLDTSYEWERIYFSCFLFRTFLAQVNNKNFFHWAVPLRRSDNKKNRLIFTWEKNVLNKIYVSCGSKRSLFQNFFWET